MVQRLYSVTVDTNSKAGESPVRRSILSADELMSCPADGVETLHDVLTFAAASYKHRHAFGYRKLEDTFNEEKQISRADGKQETKKWTYFQLSQYHYYSYLEALELAKAVGAGLRKLGMKKDDRLHIFASTRYKDAILIRKRGSLTILAFVNYGDSVEWMLMAHGE